MSRSLLISMQSELDFKDQTIDDLKKDYLKCLVNVKELQKDLDKARAYIKTLPTQLEIETIKKEFASIKDEKSQLVADLCRSKEKNLKLEVKMVDLKKTVFELNSSLKNKIIEVKALQDVVFKWEQRRKAAVQAGEITVEDVLADKTKLEKEIAGMLEFMSLREGNFNKKLELLKTRMKEEKQQNQADRDEILSLRAKLKNLEEQLSASEQTIVKMQEAKQDLDQDYRQLSSELSALTAKDKRRDKIEDRIECCLSSISRCRIDGQKMIRFIQSALDRQFLDPSLLFAASNDGTKLLSKASENRGAISIDDLEKRAEARIKEIVLLEEELNKCQQQMNELYVSHLCSSLSNQCNVQ